MNKRVLVIDDDKALRLLYEKELSHRGYHVETTGSARQGIALVASGHFDLVILDIEMPDMIGLEALAELRQAAPTTRVVINSAYSTYKADFKSWLADDYVVKSSDLEPLLQKISDLTVSS
ncbi:MAG: response regulator [bacterium]